MSALTVLLFIATLSLAGWLWFEVEARKKAEELYRAAKHENAQLFDENLHLTEVAHAATTLNAHYTGKLEEFAAELTTRHENVYALFRRLYQVLSKLPEYRKGNREMVAAGNRMRANLIDLVGNGILGDDDANQDPLVAEIEHLHQKLTRENKACQDKFSAR